MERRGLGRWACHDRLFCLSERLWGKQAFVTVYCGHSQSSFCWLGSPVIEAKLRVVVPEVEL